MPGALRIEYNGQFLQAGVFSFSLLALFFGDENDYKRKHQQQQWNEANTHAHTH